jgi:hypothetical protein
MRPLRFIPNDGALVEVTTRTLHSRYLLRSSRELDEIIVGVLGRAQRIYEVRVCGYLFLSSHYHLLLDVDDARQLGLFMAYVNSNLAREVSRLHRWPEKIWSRRYQGIVISHEEAAQIARLRYLLANGCKEGLVARPQDWPGVHVAKALIQGENLTGAWFHRAQEYAARNRGEKFDRLQYASPETLYLSPLPCWKHLAEEAWRTRALSLIQEIAAETEAHLGQNRESAVGSRGDPEPASPPSAQNAEEIPRAALPCLQLGRPPRALGSLPSLRWRLPAGRRQAAGGKSRCCVSAGELPAGVALRRRVSLPGFTALQMSCCDRGVGEVCPLGLFSASETIRPGKNQGTSRVSGAFPRSMRLKERELSHKGARKVSSLHDSFKNHLAPFWDAWQVEFKRAACLSITRWDKYEPYVHSRPPFPSGTPSALKNVLNAAVTWIIQSEPSRPAWTRLANR